MRSIVRRDTGESYQAFLAGLAKASIETRARVWRDWIVVRTPTIPMRRSRR